MVDNVAITSGSGTTVAADDISSVFYQRVKVTWGADGTANDVNETTPMPVQGADAEDAAAGGNPVAIGGRYDSSARTLDNGDRGELALSAQGHAITQVANSSGTVQDPIGIAEDATLDSGTASVPIVGHALTSKAALTDTDAAFFSINAATGDLRVDGGQIFAFENAPTVTAGAYTANDCVGGEIEITTAARISGGGGIITQVVMAVEDNDADGVAASDYDIFIFKSNPGGTYTDNIALAVSDADAFEVEAVITLDEFFDCGNVSILQAKNLNIPYICDATSLWAVVVDRTGNTLEATTAVQLRFKMIRD